MHSVLVALEKIKIPVELSLELISQERELNYDYYQVATALLVAGSTLTFWIPPFASTSSYSSVVQSTRLLV